MIRPALALVLVAALGACSSSGDGDADKDTKSKASLAGAVCSKDAAAKKVSLPSGFPADFPLPPGTIVYSAQDRGADQGIVVTGVTATAFSAVLAALQKDLPAKGFHPEDGEVEPHDAESDWSSSTYQGRWAIRELPSSQCPGDTIVNVVARKAR